MNQELVKQCEKLSLLKGETYFIFHEDSDFFVGAVEEFNKMPSRFSFYDTNSKILDNYKRYNDAYNFFINLELTPSEYNLGREYDQTFTNEFGVIVTLKPNLFYSIKLNNNNNTWCDFKGFFNKEVIYKKLGRSNYKQFTRNIKLLSLTDL